jgi:hypothetical protein
MKTIRIFTIFFISTFLILLNSCINQGNKTTNEKSLSVNKDKIIDIPFLDKYTTRDLPVIETTNFDNYKFKDSLSREEIKILKLEKVVNGDILNIWINYRINISPNYRTIVVSYMPNDNELYTVLINYTKNYDIIDFDTVAYDEIAESCTRIVSEIKKKSLEVTHINYCSENPDNPEKNTIIYIIAENGEIEASH